MGWNAQDKTLIQDKAMLEDSEDDCTTITKDCSSKKEASKEGGSKKSTLGEEGSKNEAAKDLESKGKDPKHADNHVTCVASEASPTEHMKGK